MTTDTNIPHCLIVDKSRRYTRTQARAGGRISGETRRRRSHPWHRLARRLYRNSKGCNYSQIARALGRHVSTVSRVLRGVIKTLLDASEIAAGVRPYPAGSATKTPPLARTVYTPVVQVPARGKSRRRSRWNWCKEDCARDHRHWYSRWQWANQQENAPSSVNGVRCRCLFVMESTAQVCPMCGRQYMVLGLPFPAALQMVVADWVRDTLRHYGKPVKTLLRVDRPEWAGELCRQFQSAGFRFERVSTADTHNEKKIAGYLDPKSDIIGLVVGGDL